MYTRVCVRGMAGEPAEIKCTLYTHVCVRGVAGEPAEIKCTLVFVSGVWQVNLLR